MGGPPLPSAGPAEAARNDFIIGGSAMGSHWHLYPLRVRYQETDRMDVVYYANYVNWFEIGRTEFIRHAGWPYRLVEDAGLLLPVTDLTVRYERPARYDDRIVICTRLHSVTPLRLAFDSQVRLIGEDGLPSETADAEGAPPGGTVATEEALPGELLAAGGTRHVWLNRDWRPVRLDRAQPELYALLRRIAAACTADSS